MSVWRDIHKTGDLTLLVYEGEANEEQILDAWDKIDNSFILEFGISEQRMNYLIKVKQLITAYCDNIISGSPIAGVNIKVKTKEIEDLFKEQQSAEIGRVISQVTKFMGQRIDLKSTTIYEFYNHYNLMVSQYKAG